MNALKKLIFFFITFSLVGQTAYSPYKKASSPTFSFDIPYEKFSFSASACKTFVSTHGSIICVPEGTLFQNGKSYKGQVLLYYRELHTPLDMLVSGIKMKTTDGKHLNSYGMFELFATDKQGNPLEIAPGKEIKVRFASRYKQPANLRLYKYDASREVWENSDLPFQAEKPSPLEGVKYEDLYVKYTAQDEDNWDDDDDAWDDDAWEGVNWENEEYEEFATQVFYTLGIDKFGLYNYDKPIEGENQIPLIASFLFKNPDFKNSQTKIIVVYIDLNTVYYFYPYEWKDFFLLKNRDYNIFAISKGKRLDIFNEKIPNLEALKGKEYDFKMKMLAQNVSNLKTLKKHLKF